MYVGEFGSVKSINGTMPQDYKRGRRYIFAQNYKTIDICGASLIYQTSSSFSRSGTKPLRLEPIFLSQTYYTSYKYTTWKTFDTKNEPRINSRSSKSRLWYHFLGVGKNFNSNNETMIQDNKRGRLHIYIQNLKTLVYWSHLPSNK